MTSAAKRLRPAEDRLWAIVLAGGEGTRLAAVTRAVYGHDVPKQFAALGSARTFLEETMGRIAPLVPRTRTLVVVSETQVALARESLAAYPGVRVVVQPRNRGTTAGVLLPLLHVLAAEPDALVAVFPCDHRFRRNAAFHQAVRRAATAGARGGVILVGAAPDGPAPDLGWIVPARAGRPFPGGARLVRRFVEKPPLATSWELLRLGGLWNTLVIAAQARALWRAAERHAPAVAGPLGRWRRKMNEPDAAEALRAIYADLPASDLSRDVLEVARGLRVVPMVDSGWCDCGTPARLLGALEPAVAARLRRILRRERVEVDGVAAARRRALA